MNDVVQENKIATNKKYSIRRILRFYIEICVKVSNYILGYFSRLPSLGRK